MSQFCPNFANTETVKQFHELEKYFGTPRAYHLWDLNNGVGFDYLPDQTKNVEFQQLEKTYGRKKAFEIYAFKLLHPEYQDATTNQQINYPPCIEDFDVLQNQLNQLYPEIQVNFTNKPIKDDHDTYLGESDIKAKTILIDTIAQNLDTLPHEYAHHYIAWFRGSNIVQKAIKSFGTEEALVTAIGQQVAQRKGKAYSFWKRFVNWIKSLFNDQTALLNTMTDLFLMRRDLCSIKRVAEIHHQKANSIVYNKEQQNAIDGIYKWLLSDSPTLGDQFCTLAGKAGTGKTTVTKEILTQYLKERKEAKVILAAPTHNAKINLANAVGSIDNRKFETLTVAAIVAKKLEGTTHGVAFTNTKQFKEEIVNADVIVIDEASMINDEDINNILAIAQKNSSLKVLFLGDPGQINPVKQVTPSRAFNVANNYLLVERVRQGESSPILPFADHYWMDDKTKTSWDHPTNIQTKITPDGSLIVTPTISDVNTMKNQIVPAFQKALDNNHLNFIRIIAGTNDKRAYYNQSVQQALFGNQVHPRTNFAIGDWVTANTTYGEEHDPGASFVNAAVGKIIQQNYVETKLDQKFGCHYVDLQILKEDGYTIAVRSIIPSDRVKFQNAYAAAQRQIALDKNLSNREKKSQQRQLHDYVESFADIDCAYAITAHKSQGQTYDIAIVDKKTIWDVDKWEETERARLTYTAVTRARKMAIVVDTQGELFPEESILNIVDNTNSKAVTKYDQQRMRNGIQQSLESPTQIEELPQSETSSEELIELYKKFYDDLIPLRALTTNLIRYYNVQDEQVKQLNQLSGDYLTFLKGKINAERTNLHQLTQEYFIQYPENIDSFFTALAYVLNQSEYQNMLQDSDTISTRFDPNVMVDYVSSTLNKPHIENISTSPTQEEAIQVLNSKRTILSNAELANWNAQGLGAQPRILVASEHSDPAFHVKFLKDVIAGKKSIRNKTGQLLTGKDFNGLYIITKHDGLPMKEILELPIPKLIHFSITGLGNTEYEPGVMKANDLLDRIEEYIQKGLDPNCVTIRIDPIVPGVTTRRTIENIVRRAKQMGIKRIKFSIMDVYPSMIQNMKKNMPNYDFNKYYPNGSKHTTDEIMQQIVHFMEELSDKYNVEMHTCAENIVSTKIQKDGCLSVTAVNEMLGTNLIDKGKDNNKQRPECTCFGNKTDALAYMNACLSHCWYCFARHTNETALQYYNEDGTLKQNRFTDVKWKSSAKKIINQNPLHDVVTYSGGAHGADGFWSNIGTQYGLGKAVHFTASNQPYVMKNVTSGVMQTMTEADNIAAQKAMLQLTGIRYTNPLHLRNYYQVSNSQGVYAIGEISDHHDVLGGTGVAIQVAQALGKPIYVWDLTAGRWKTYDYQQRQFVDCETPVLCSRSATIGTRDIESYLVRQPDGQFQSNANFVGKAKADKAIQAIKDVYLKTIKEGVMLNPPSFEGERLHQTTLDLQPQDYSERVIGTNKTKLIEQTFTPIVKNSTTQNTLTDFLEDVTVPLPIKNELAQNFANVVFTVLQELMDSKTLFYDCETRYPTLFQKKVKFNNVEQSISDHIQALQNANVENLLQQIVDVITPKELLTMCADLFVTDTEWLDDQIQQYAQNVPNNLEFYGILISPILKTICGLSFKTITIKPRKTKTLTETVSANVQTTEKTNEDTTSTYLNGEEQTAPTSAETSNDDKPNDFLPVDQKTISLFKNIDNKLKLKLNSLIQIDSRTRLPAYSRFNVPQYYNYRTIILAIMPFMRNVTSEIQMTERLTNSRLPFVQQLLQLCEEDATFSTLLYTQIRRSYNQYFEVYHKKSKGEYTTQHTDIQYADKHVDKFAVKRQIMSTASLDQNSLFTAEKLLTPETIYVNEQVRQQLSNQIQTLLEQLTHRTVYDSLEEFNNDCFTPNVQQQLNDLCQQMGLIQITPEVMHQFIYALRPNDDKYDSANLQLLLRQLQYILNHLAPSVQNNTTIANYPFKSGAISTAVNAYVTVLEYLYPYQFNDQEATKWVNGKQYPINTPINYIQKVTQAIRYSTTSELDQYFSKLFLSDIIKKDLFRLDAQNHLQPNPNKPSYIADILNITNANIRELIGFDTFLSYDKVDFKHMTEQQYVTTALTVFASDKTNKSLKNNHLTRYFLPVLADKTTTGAFTWFKTQNYKQLQPYLRTLVYQEIDRMVNVYQRAKANDGTNALINYDVVLNDKGELPLNQAGIKFYFLPCFNQYLSLINDEESCKNIPMVAMLHNAIYQDGRYADMVKIKLSEIRQQVDATIQEFLNDSYQTWITQLKTKNYYDILQKDVVYDSTLYPSFDKFLASFFFNNFYFNTQLFQLLTSDLNFYKNTDDIQKRIAEFVSPGTAHSTTTRNNVSNLDLTTKRVIILENQCFDSKQVKGIKHLLQWNLKNRIKLIQSNSNLTEQQKNQYIDDLKQTYERYQGNYERIDGTDGQGLVSLDYVYKAYTTLGRQEEFTPLYKELKILLNQLDLNWSKAKRNQWKKQVQECLKKYSNVHIEVMKQFTYSQLQTEDTATQQTVTRPFQIKNAEYALIDFVSMLESEDDTLLQLSKFMNDNAIDAIYFQSNCKVGTSGVVKTNKMSSSDLIFTLNDILQDPKKTKTYVYDIPMSDVVLQQETPRHFLNHESDLGGQIRKLFLNDITDQTNIGGKLVDTNVNGIPAKQFREEFEQMLTRKVELNFNKFITEELNLPTTILNKLKRTQSVQQLTTNERLKLHEALSQMLLKSLSSEGTISLDDLQAFSLDENGNFNLTTSDPLMFRIIDKILTTTLKHTVLDCKIGGGQLVQVTDAFRLNQFNGDKVLDDSLQIYFYDKNNQLTTDPSKAIRVAYLECEMPIYDQRIIDIYANKYGIIDEDGMKRIEEECPEILNIIGYRIPTEGLCSMFPIKIKRFCHPIAGGIIKLPQEIVAIGGMDFDIDKLFFCHNSFLVSDDKKRLVYPKGHIEHIQNMNKEQINNMILNHIRTVLTSPLVLQKQFMPSSFNRITHEGNLMEAWSLMSTTNTSKSTLPDWKSLSQKTDSELENIIRQYQAEKPICSFATQQYLFQRNTQSQAMLAIFANASSMHTYLKHARIPIANAPTFTLNGHTISTGSILDNVVSQDNVTEISEIIRQFLAAAADGIKCPDLERMGLNLINIQLALPLLRLGFNMHSVALFVQQPVIKQFCQLYQIESNKLIAENRTNHPSTEEICEHIRQLYNGADIALTDNPNFDEESLVLGTKFNFVQPISQDTDQQKELRNLQFNILNIVPFLIQLNSELVSQSRILKRDSKTTVRYQDSFEIFHTQLRDDEFLSQCAASQTIIGEKFAQMIANRNDLTFSHLHTIEDITDTFHNTLIGYLNPNFVHFYDVVRPEICLQIGRVLSSKETKKLYYDWLLFLTTNDPQGLLCNSKAMEYYYTYTFPHKFFAQLPQLLQDKTLSHNTFLQNLQPETFGEEQQHLIISLDSFGLSDKTLQQMRTDWLVLLRSSNKEYQQLARELFIYDLYRNGFQPGDKSYGYLFPTIEKMNMQNYQDFWNKPLSANLTALQINEFIELAVRNNADILTRIKKEKPTCKYYLKKNVIYCNDSILQPLGVPHVSKSYSLEHLSPYNNSTVEGLNNQRTESIMTEEPTATTTTSNPTTLFNNSTVQGMSAESLKQIEKDMNEQC